MPTTTSSSARSRRRRKRGPPADAVWTYTPSPQHQGEFMSDLIAIAYPDQATAERVRGRLGEAVKAKILELDDAVVVTRREDGKIKLHQAASGAGVGAAGGALWGGLIGLIFLAPLLGMAVGAAAGAAGGALADYGVDDSFMK